jgi:hypothetical protein
MELGITDDGECAGHEQALYSATASQPPSFGTARRVGAVKLMRGPDGMIPVGLMVRWLP